MDPLQGDNRSSSAQAYLTPVEHTRTNWLTLVNHTVTSISWDTNVSPLRAAGVTFSRTDDPTVAYIARTKREVILAAGAIQSPALLQLSGVGDPELLHSLGINSVVNLPTVGKNLQEQTQSVLMANGTGVDTGGQGIADTIAFPNVYQLFGSGSDDAVAKIRGSLRDWSISQADHALDGESLYEIMKLQADIIINGSAPVVELFYFVNSAEYVHLTSHCIHLFSLTISAGY